MNTRWILSLALSPSLLSGSLNAQSGAPASVPASWAVVVPPPPESPAAVCANWADTTWHVALNADSTEVLAWPRTWPASPNVVTFPDGQLVGFDGGEFGGGVLWKPDHGRQVKLTNENLKYFVPLPSGLYGLVGLAHMGLNDGRLLRFRRVDGRWRVDTAADLHAAPYGFTPLGGDSLLVLTISGLTVVAAPSGVRKIADGELWSWTIPQSVVRDRAGVVYVGMRFAVARLSPEDNYKESWLIPGGCPHREPKPTGYGCVCTAAE